jgi:hypothetical protein
VLPAGDHVEQRGLARTRATDQTHELARAEPEAYVVERVDDLVAAAIGLRKRVRVQDEGELGFGGGRRRGRPPPVGAVGLGDVRRRA